MDLVPEQLKNAASAQFVREIRRFHNHLATGFIGTPRLLPALHLAGRDDVAYEVLNQARDPAMVSP